MLLLLLSYLAFAGDESPSLYIETNAVQAARVMKGICSKDFGSLKGEGERLEWVRARLAWIALERLQGRDEEALRIFEGCGGHCAGYAPEKEWSALKEWACGKKKEAKPCLSNTKAQKPSL